MYHLLLLLERLQKGDISRTDMDVFHSLLYKHNHTTTAEDWKRMLDPEKTFVFYDGFLVSEEKREDAFRMIPEFVERCDFMIVLAPGCTHFDKIDQRTGRKMNLCYRTYRLRARCVFEMFSSFLTTKGGEQVRPALLVRSGTGTPNWVSPLECQKLSVSSSSFACCEANHRTDHRCARIHCLELLCNMIDTRSRSLFACNKYAEARGTQSRINYWTRNLFDNASKKTWNSLCHFKTDLKWDTSKDDEWFDRERFPLLAYAAPTDCRQIIQDALSKMSRIRKEGYVTLGVSGGMTTLMIAMMTASSEVVSMLLESGANVDSVDVMGNDGFMFASMFGRAKNMQCWLERVKDCDLNRQNTVVGGCALGQAVYMGANKLDTVKVLLNAGASLDYRTFGGGSALENAVSNEDSDPDVVRLLLEQFKSSCSPTEFSSIVNYKRASTTFKWKSIYFVAKALYRTGTSKTGLMAFLAVDSGTTALNQAVMRGGVEILKILLENGADPFVENDLGLNAFELCEKSGPFPSVKRVLKEHVNQDE